MECCQFVVRRSPWGRLGSVLDVCNRPHRIRGYFRRHIHMFKSLASHLALVQIPQGLSRCTGANAGFYVAGEAAEEQTPCRPGFLSATAASTCELCAAGEFSADEGKASCTSCPAGKSSAAGATGCTRCEAGSAKPAGPCPGCRDELSSRNNPPPDPI